MDIPVSFTYKGKSFSGKLSSVSGAGGMMWHLYDHRNFYYGQLVFTQTNGWRFHNKAGDMGYLSEYFAQLVEAVK